MKSLTQTQLKFTAFLILLFTGFFAMAQAPVVPPVISLDPVSEVDLFTQILAFVGGYKALGVGAAVLAAIQLLVLFIKTPIAGKLFHKLDASAKMIIIQGLTIISAYIGFKMAGFPIGESIVKTISLPMLQEFLLQMYKNFIAKKA